MLDPSWLHDIVPGVGCSEPIEIDMEASIAATQSKAALQTSESAECICEGQEWPSKG